MNKNLSVLTPQEEINTIGGEGVTLALVCAVMCVSILCIVVWKLFVSNKGEIQLPGGFKFEWSAIKRAANLIKK